MKKINQKTATTLLLFTILLLFGSCSKEGTVDPQTNAFILRTISSHPLPDNMNECSGIEYTDSLRFWIHNDAGNSAKLQAIDGEGQPGQVIHFNDLPNDDWEDLAQDTDGNFYIGNFGNNNNDRTDLAIYKIPSPEEITSNNHSYESILFSFEDQVEFPPPKSQFHFDTEAFFAHDNKLYLFTKDRSKPFKGLTNLYELPHSPGSHVAKRLTTFYTSDKKSEGAITGADISPDGQTVALLSKDLVWLFTDFEAPNFLSGSAQQMTIPHDRQFEGIVFKNDCIIYIAAERRNAGEDQLYQFSICE